MRRCARENALAQPSGSSIQNPDEMFPVELLPVTRIVHHGCSLRVRGRL
jgi:hypothetical protein